MSNNTNVKKTNENEKTKNKLNPENKGNTVEQLRSLLLNIIPGTEQKMNIDSLTTGWKKEKAHKFLKKNWQIKDIASVHQTIDYILNEGDRSIYNILLPHFLSSDCKKGRRMRLKERYMAIELLMRYSDNLSDCANSIQSNSLNIDEKDMKRGILAWDMCQLITTARTAFDAGYLTEQEAWNYITQAYKLCKYEFDNWEQISKSILIGGGMKLGTKKCFNKFLKTHSLLLNNPDSFYHKTDFK